MWVFFWPDQTKLFHIKKESLVVVLLLRMLQYYILIRPFTVITENEAVSYIFNYMITNGHILWWRCELMEYNFALQNLPGHLNVVADRLSIIEDSLADIATFAMETPDLARNIPGMVIITGSPRTHWSGR